jgi:hypothetical protein
MKETSVYWVWLEELLRKYVPSNDILQTFSLKLCCDKDTKIYVVRWHVCKYVCMYVGMYVCLYVCICVYVCMCVCIVAEHYWNIIKC